MTSAEPYSVSAYNTAKESENKMHDDAVAKPLSGSYHDVWMELHEDLILTQGIDRAEEGSA